MTIFCPSFAALPMIGARVSASRHAFGMTMLIGSAALAGRYRLALSRSPCKLRGSPTRRRWRRADAPARNAAAERIIAAIDGVASASRALTRRKQRHVADPGILAEQRFAGGGSSPNAVRVVLTRDRPLSSASFLTGRQGHHHPRDRDRSAAGLCGLFARVAGRRRQRRLAESALLSSLTGSQLNLSVMDYNALASTDIDLLAFSDALRTQIGADVLTFGQTLDAQVTLPQVVSALASASQRPGGDRAGTYRRPRIAAQPGAVARIDLGPRSSSVRVDAANPVKVNALSLLRAMLLLRECQSPARPVGRQQPARRLGESSVALDDRRAALRTRP